MVLLFLYLFILNRILRKFRGHCLAGFDGMVRDESNCANGLGLLNFLWNYWYQSAAHFRTKCILKGYGSQWSIFRFEKKGKINIWVTHSVLIGQKMTIIIAEGGGFSEFAKSEDALIIRHKLTFLFSIIKISSLIIN